MNHESLVNQNIKKGGSMERVSPFLTLFDSGGICPHHHVIAYTRVCIRIQVLIFLLFLILSVEEGTTLLTPKKITVFPGTKKVGQICPTFIRGDPYEPHRPREKVTFSDH